MSTATEQKSPAKSMTGLNLQELLQDLFLVLTQKETEVVKRRFALSGYQSKQTLEKIGKHFNVTRERIRQIESIALNKLKRTVRTTKFNDINDMAKGILKMSGGIMLSSELVSAVLKKLPGSQAIDGAVLRLSFAIDPEMSSEGHGQTYKPFWRLATVSADDIANIIDTGVKLLQKRHSCMRTSEVISSIQAMPMFEQNAPSNELILGCLSVDERLKEIAEGWGLTDWRFVRPRSIRDKVEIILRKTARPMHFVEIANSIKDATFDHKNVTIQAVHNELIRYPQFVLVGRGLYALREWGYEPGTVADIIESILKKKGPLSKKQIIEEVSKQRTVKLGTISLNLQKMPYFVRVGRAVYDFDASKK